MARKKEPRSLIAPLAFALMSAAPALIPAFANAGANIRILPDQAALACQAKAEYELSARGGHVMAINRYQTERGPNFMFHVTGEFVAMIGAEVGAEERLVSVECDVSSSEGVELFTMIVGA
ncbi:MAG: hypothetical protein AAFU55_06475 [Pseudomonadota bacterium]